MKMKRGYREKSSPCGRTLACSANLTELLISLVRLNPKTAYRHLRNSYYLGRSLRLILIFLSKAKGRLFEGVQEAFSVDVATENFSIYEKKMEHQISQLPLSSMLPAAV